MKKILFIVFVVLMTLHVSAQKESNIWYFGTNAGVDFNSGVPVALTNGVLNSYEGCATMCDKNGALLFYTDGVSVWTRNHTVMPNGSSLAGHSSATQSGIIVPKPGSSTRYYVFTVSSEIPYAGNFGAIPFSYSEVDMTLNGGLGDVIGATKNTLLFTGSTEKITAVRHANGKYFWVVGQDRAGAYRAFLVDCNGVNAPVISNVGHPSLLTLSGAGYLMMSPDGHKMANAMWAQGYFLFDFDNTTGVVSNMIALGTISLPNYGYGITFSPDSKLLYGVNVNDGKIVQWDTQAGTSAAIIASGTAIGTASGSGAYKGGAMQIGPDGKVYVVQFQQHYLSTISNPNTLGTGCNFQTNVVNLQSGLVNLGLPCFLPKFTDTIIHTKHCYGDTTAFSIDGTLSYAASVLWDFGDPASGTLDTSTKKSLGHRFSKPGTFTVKVITYLPCISDTTYSTVVIDSLPLVDLGNDIQICADSVTLQSSKGYANATYLWNTGDTQPSLAVKQTGTYLLAVTQGICTGKDSVNVELVSNLTVNLGPDTTVCSNASVTLRSEQPPGVQYIWSNGLTATQITIALAGKYWLHVSKGKCDGSDTINITVVKAPEILIGPDSTICEATPMKIGAFIPDATYRWSNDSTTPFIYVSKTDDYVLTLTYGPCIVKDTVAITAMPNPEINLGIDTDICPKQIVVLNAGNEGSTYLWYNGSTLPTDTAKQAGKYWVQVTSPYKCVSSDTVTFKSFALPSIILGDDTTVCEETPLILKPIYSINEESLLWSTGSTERQIEITQGGTYMVSAINKCGPVSDTINIRQIFCDIWLPNAFTPNGDGINDILKVLGNIGRLQDFSLGLYNRWGEQVFITTDKYSGWNGRYKGGDCSMDTYVYMLQYSLDGKPVVQKGNVTLIR